MGEEPKTESIPCKYNAKVRQEDEKKENISEMETI